MRYASITSAMMSRLLCAADHAIGDCQSDTESALLDANAVPADHIVAGSEFYVVTMSPYGSSVCRINTDGSLTQLLS